MRSGSVRGEIRAGGSLGAGAPRALAALPLAAVAGAGRGEGGGASRGRAGAARGGRAELAAAAGARCDGRVRRHLGDASAAFARSGAGRTRLATGVAALDGAASPRRPRAASALGSPL